MRKKLLIAVAVLAVLFVAADRIAVAVAENQISGRIATAYGLSNKPSVSISGFPFLTQVVTGDYQQINVSAPKIQAGDVSLRDLSAHFTGVHAKLSQVIGHGPADITADQATGSAVVPFTEISQRLPHGLELKPSGKRITVSFSMRCGGKQVPLSASVAVKVAGSALILTPAAVGTSGCGLPVSAYSSALRIALPLTELPFHLRLTSVNVTPTGLQIGVSARNVLFAQA